MRAILGLQCVRHVATRQKRPIVVFKDLGWVERAMSNLWRGSLLPLGCEAAPENGPAAQSSGSKLPRHRDLRRGHFLRQSEKRRRQPGAFSLLEAVQVLENLRRILE